MSSTICTPRCTPHKLSRMAQTLRRWIVEQAIESGVGHIGSALSIVEIMTALWGRVMHEPGTGLADRDRFVLAKGHAALALYAALRYKDLMDEQTFHTYCKDGSLLSVHPEYVLDGIDVSTGSLGQGLSVACGLALGLKQSGSKARVYVLMSDAECNEGQVWEAAAFAAQHKLANLTVIVDYNGLQALGHTHEIIDMSPMDERWRTFGWQADDVDGHDLDGLVEILTPQPRATHPQLVVARTVLGKGVSFMENQLEWHYRYLSPELAELALSELER